MFVVVYVIDVGELFEVCKVENVKDCLIFF